MIVPYALVCETMQYKTAKIRLGVGFPPAKAGDATTHLLNFRLPLSEIGWALPFN